MVMFEDKSVKIRRGEPCPRHLLNSCGCLLPHLTKLATSQCEETRRAAFYINLGQLITNLLKNQLKTQ